MIDELTTITPPKNLTAENIVHWSTSYQQLQTEGIKQEKAIVSKAKKFVKYGLVEYDSVNKVFLIKPIPGYNKTTYIVQGDGNRHFQCNCQFYNTVSHKWNHPTCSHIQAVKFYLEIRRWNKHGHDQPA